jgi:hypothetical protein
MQLDSSIVSTLSAPLGSVIGGSATIAAAWRTQKTQSERDRIRIDIHCWEQLYAEFVSECSMRRTVSSAAQSTGSVPMSRSWFCSGYT